MQLSMAQLATHTRAAKVQHAGFQRRQYLCFREKYRNLVCNSVLCPKKLARIGCCLRWTCLLLLAGMDSESLWVHHLAPDDRFKSIQSTTPVEMRADLNFLKWFGSTLLLVLAIAYEPERN